MKPEWGLQSGTKEPGRLGPSSNNSALVSKVKVCLALGQEWVALEILHPSYVSNKEMQAHLDVVDLNRNVSHPEYRYVTRPDTNESL